MYLCGTKQSNMKKQLILTIALFFSAFSFAQDFEKGGHYVTVGYGFDPYYHPFNRFGIGPVVAGYEYGVTDILGIGRIGAGGTFGASFYPGTHSNGVHYTGTRFSILARAAYHFEFNVPKMDVYAGVAIGAHFRKEAYYNYNGIYADTYGYNSGVYPAYHVFGGIRYFFVPSFGVYAEAGYGLSALSGGMVFHF